MFYCMFAYACLFDDVSAIKRIEFFNIFLSRNHNLLKIKNFEYVKIFLRQLFRYMILKLKIQKNIYFLQNKRYNKAKKFIKFYGGTIIWIGLFYN